MCELTGGPRVPWHWNLPFADTLPGTNSSAHHKRKKNSLKKKKKSSKATRCQVHAHWMKFWKKPNQFWFPWNPAAKMCENDLSERVLDQVFWAPVSIRTEQLDLFSPWLTDHCCSFSAERRPFTPPTGWVSSAEWMLRGNVACVVGDLWSRWYPTGLDFSQMCRPLYRRSMWMELSCCRVLIGM